MLPNTEKLLDLLASRKLAPQNVLDKLRSRAADQSASPRSVTKYLVEKGHLTADQADKLLQEVGGGSASSKSSSSKSSSSKSSSSSKKKSSSQFGDLDPLDSLGTPGLDNLDSLLNDPSLGAPVGADYGKKKRGFGGNKWDTKLMLYGGGGLLGMVLLIFLFWFLIMGQSEEEMFDAAEEAYNAAAYTDAIGKYDQYLEAFPKSENHSIAVVHRGLSQMRQVVDSKNWEESLAVAQRVLPEIRQERQFASARSDLRIMLPDIVDGLVTKASAEQSLELLNKADEALKLAEDRGNIPEEMRSNDQMRNIQIKIRQVERILRQDERLAKAVTEINTAVAAGDTATAYRVRKELLAQYPGLLTNEQLQEAVLVASQAERDLVKYVEESREPQTEELPSTLVGEAIPVMTTGEATGGVAGEFITALVNGSVFVVDAADGSLLWRRYVGYDSISPVDIPGGDVLLFDGVNQEFVRLGGRDGALRWRLALGALPVDAPILTAGGMFIATNDRRLRHIDAEAGKQLGYYEFPQGLRNSPAASRDGNFLYLAGEHSNLFVINQRERLCSMVMHMGHEAGELHVGPYLIGAYLIIAKDNGTETSQLLVVEVTEGGSAVAVRQSNLEIRGHVYQKLAAAGKLLVVSTDRGGHYVYDVKPAGAAEPLTTIAQLPGTSRQATVPFTYLRGSEFWSAGKGLIKFEIQATGSAIRQSWARNNDDTYLQPMRVVDNLMFTLRRQANVPGDVLSAVELATGEFKWETHLAAPLVDQPWVDENGSLQTVNVAGALFNVPASGGTSGSSDSGPAAGPLVLNPTATAPLVRPLSSSASILEFAGGIRAVPKSDMLESLAWNDQDSRFTFAKLPGKAACNPFVYAGKMLVPSVDGRVYLISPQDGSNTSEPFQPIVEPGVDYAWIGVVSDSAGDALLYDGFKRLYRVGMQSEPREHLAAIAELESLVRFQGPFVRLQEIAFCATQDGNIIPISLAGDGLALNDPVIIPGGVTWGPHQAGELAVVGTASGQVHALNNSGALAWSEGRSSEESAVVNPVGTPLADDTGFWISEQSGRLVHMNAATGLVDNRLDVGRPLASGPIVWNDKFVIAGLDGTLLMLSKP